MYLSSSNSRKSSWVDFELEYYQEEVQNDIYIYIYMIILDGEDKHNFRELDQTQIESFFTLNEMVTASTY